ncbi:hypothetical protein SAMD00019534_117420 [Acytostelium subglobosum LB1]|uniref:hypothetical protein n=1 Tax=Acytostelium subglobosum LB1 TaxID=1410327 RepID=UPI00064512E7|nr:hypothetical protein SAMD00019534_117420 [Acytostelium subglobosum LB1]GAM28566.1 hypothetical protein SAMD00019534_117420 [Acytostelium subglobosum LB1]|eukprot:XP_012748605.1 hypothetical protein SAMD00019534_117420 [Acytostelium subglobosum LB1]
MTKRLCRQYSTISSTVTENSGDATHQQHYDVVIVGGGLVGTTMACSLGATPTTQHLKVCLIESQAVKPLHPLQSTPDLRTLSFNNTSVALFDAVGAWSLIKDTKRTAAFDQVRVWDASGGGGIHFANNGEPMGHILENNIVTAALFETSKQYSNVTLRSPVTVKNVDMSGGEVSDNPTTTITLSDGSQITTDLIIAADGGNSIIKKQLNMSSVGRNYNQKAVVCTLKIASNYQSNTLFQRFLPTGPIALLPLADGYASIIWSTNTLHANYLLELDDESFMTQLKHAWFSAASTSNNSAIELLHNLFSTNPNRMSGNELLLPPIESVASKRAAFPLRLDHTQSYVQQGLCLIGDAAHVVHPLAGQGVNLGLADVIALTKSLGEGVASGYSVGNRVLLDRYQEERQFENIKMMASIDTLFNLFTHSSLPIMAIRNVGMSILDTLTPLKNAIMSISKGNKEVLRGVGKQN